VDIVYKLYRSSDTTNQRIHFDIEPCGRHLATGGQDGMVHIYDLQGGQWVTAFQAAAGMCFWSSVARGVDVSVVLPL
jgi:WD40 repeat protein